MPIVSGDIDFFLSGGSGNTNPNNSLGGVISTTEVIDDTLHNVFDKVTGDQALAGDTNYRGIYVKNSHASITLETTIIWINQNTTNSEIAIGLSAQGLNATMTAIANESTAPAAVSFSQPANKAAGLTMGDIPATQNYGYWLRRVIAPATAAENAATFHIKVEGDTAA